MRRESIVAQVSGLYESGTASCTNIHMYSDVQYTLVAGLLAKVQYPEVPATGHLGTGFLVFPVSISKC